ncbi:beta-propeller fold lactonase family protein [Leptospira idonii]|uniref:Fibronectin type-III domain-containing protein n=1 Tax=Leptospira idonii TaxID=1193500 RepID=A0A4R9LTP6_9LEPT|nr:beta-propeller fold lactonase family protein [Leptospira idonii]TGN17105.1 hypothetical protein EHS15_18185 [Leptospira idonii]
MNANLRNLLLTLIFFCISCNKVNSGASSLLLALGGASFFQTIDSREIIIPPSEVSIKAPELVLPGGMNPKYFGVEKLNEPPPPRLNAHYIPISAVYEIGALDSAFQSVKTEADLEKLRIPEGESAKISFSYDKSKLADLGLAEDFAVFYQDALSGHWKKLNYVSVDKTTKTVTALTNHFTPFVLTSVYSNVGNLPAAPSCILSEYPDQIQSPSFTGGYRPRFYSVKGGHRFYADRDYVILDDQNFASLGFENALGISTCEGSSDCGVSSLHSLSNQNQYLEFEMNVDFDIFVMYDTRGGSGSLDERKYDTSQDPNWLRSNFTLLKDIEGLPVFLRTTSSADYYSIYYKTVKQNEKISLGGNRFEVTDPNIQSNYWVVVKPAGFTGNRSSRFLCTRDSVREFPGTISKFTGIPGKDQVTLSWSQPVEKSFAKVLLRKSTLSSPSDPLSGIDLDGVEISRNVYIDKNLLSDANYYYTLFALDSENNVIDSKSILVRTGADTDNDGVSDDAEIDITFGNGNTSKLLVDTDGDGISDGEEIAAGTDPTLGDSQKPVISQFLLQSLQLTSFPIIEFKVQSTDNVQVKKWSVTESSDPPSSFDSRWSSKEVISFTGTEKKLYRLYAWVMDAAGNVSSAVPPIEAEIEGFAYSKYFYLTKGNGIETLEYSLSSFGFDSIGYLDLGETILDTTVNDAGSRLIVSLANSFRVYSIDANTGVLAEIARKPHTYSYSKIKLSGSGGQLFAQTGNYIHKYTLDGNDSLVYIGSIFGTSAGGVASGYTLEGDRYRWSDSNPRFWGDLSPIPRNVLFDFDITYSGDAVFYPVIEKYLPPPTKQFDEICTRGIPPICNNADTFTWIQSFETGGYLLKINSAKNADYGSSLAQLLLGDDGDIINIAISRTNPNLLFALTANNKLKVFSVETNISATYQSASVTLPNGSSGFDLDPKGKYLFVSNFSNQTVSRYDITENGSISFKDTISTSFPPKKILFSPKGEQLFVFSDSHIQTFLMNSISGSISELALVEIGSGVIKTNALTRSDLNLPPILQTSHQNYLMSSFVENGDLVQEKLWEGYGHLGASTSNWGGFLITLYDYPEFNGQIRYLQDPDAERCNANVSQYRYTFDILSKPPTSNLTRSKIQHRNLIGNGSSIDPSLTGWFKFKPDKPGKYMLTSSWTDHQGNCGTDPQTGTKTLTLQTGTLKTASGYSLIGDPLPPLRYPGASRSITFRKDEVSGRYRYVLFGDGVFTRKCTWPGVCDLMTGPLTTTCRKLGAGFDSYEALATHCSSILVKKPFFETTFRWSRGPYYKYTDSWYE